MLLLVYPGTGGGRQVTALQRQSYKLGFTPWTSGPRLPLLFRDILGCHGAAGQLSTKDGSLETDIFVDDGGGQ